MQGFINMLSLNLEYISMHSNDECITFQVKSRIEDPVCPYCGTISYRWHSKYK